MFTGFLKDGNVILSDDGYPIVESDKPEVPSYCKLIPNYHMADNKIIQTWIIVPELNRTGALEYYVINEIMKLDDDQALRYIIIFPEWSSDNIKYKQGDRIRYEMIMYRCISDHISQPDYNPKDKNEYWEKVVKA